MLILLAAVITFISTASGGLFGLKLRGYIYSLLGLTAGVLLGVVAFDLLPEIFSTAEKNNFDPMAAMVALVIGFLGFHIIEKLTIIHHGRETDYAEQHHPAVGTAAALALSGHSFLDGMGIGLAFQVNTSVGLGVALAVVAHDFYDGLNTVNLMLINQNSVRRALYMLMVDALAPVLGALSTFLISLNEFQLMIYLGIFAGFLLYIGVSEILPKAHSKRPSVVTLLLTVVGVAAMYFISGVHI